MRTTFSKRMRDGKVSLWVARDGFNPYNIWDLTTEEATPEVLKAIQCAFDRGVLFAVQSFEESKPYAAYSVGKEWAGQE